MTTPVDAALEQALRALRYRDRTACEIERFLESRGVGKSDRSAVVEKLVRTALVDDRRYAESRALTLAERGAGNERIRHELSFAGVGGEDVDAAIAGLASEADRTRPGRLGQPAHLGDPGVEGDEGRAKNRVVTD